MTAEDLKALKELLQWLGSVVVTTGIVVWRVARHLKEIEEHKARTVNAIAKLEGDWNKSLVDLEGSLRRLRDTTEEHAAMMHETLSQLAAIQATLEAVKRELDRELVHKQGAWAKQLWELKGEVERLKGLLR